ncbi:MAG: prolipoprotein diacylglyceryl transferase [Candidatus Eisenbacteria sp.]|nr:prolipoprotein diacylglyceryl transferase [Candidatus Eisenbacteria bacterium]
MRPILLELGPLRIHAYGFALALSFLIGSIWVARRGRMLGYREDELSKLYFWVLASALIGARLYYAFQHPEDYEGDWIGIFRLWRGGLTQHGGVIGAIVVAWFFVRSRHWSFREIADLMAPAVALGEGITRVGGCFLAGCCHGRPCDLPWAVEYPVDSPAHGIFGATPLHPSPLYLAVGNILLFLWLSRMQSMLLGTGRVFAIYLAGASLIRFLVDYTRYYVPGDYISVLGMRLTHSQWLSLGLIAVALLVWFLPRRGEARAPASESSGEESSPSA